MICLNRNWCTRENRIELATFNKSFKIPHNLNSCFLIRLRLVLWPSSDYMHLTIDAFLYKICPMFGQRLCNLGPHQSQGWCCLSNHKVDDACPSHLAFIKTAFTWRHLTTKKFTQSTNVLMLNIQLLLHLFNLIINITVICSLFHRRLNKSYISHIIVNLVVWADSSNPYIPHIRPSLCQRRQMPPAALKERSSRFIVYRLHLFLV